MITLNNDKTELKIINTKKDENKSNDDVIHYYPLYYLSEFIYLQNNLVTLIINGFDFDLNDIKNNNITKLYINYNYDKENGININNLLDIDNYNIINNFPKLEEINIGYIKNNFKIIKSLMKKRIYPTNLKTINIYSFGNFKNINSYQTNVELNIIYKNTENKLIEKNEEDEEKIDEMVMEDYKDEKDIIVPKKKNRKRKNKKKDYKDEKINLVLIGKYIEVKTDKYLEKKKIIYFDSNLIKIKKDFHLIHQSLLLIFQNINLDTINFKRLVYYQYQYESDLCFKIKDDKNILIIIEKIFEKKYVYY